MNLDKLIEKANGSKYTLVVIAAKRARSITAGDEPRVRCYPDRPHKPVVVALQEIASNKVNWVRTKESQ